jgi:S1-C subfamily serine protease
MKRLAGDEADPARKRSYENEYRHRQREYQAARDDYDTRRRRYEAQKRAYESQRTAHAYGRAVGNLSQSFEIILADNTPLNVRLVATSTDHDLALLKLDGYRTPALAVAATGRLTPGRPLYAVGNPAKLKNSVTSGVFSGFENGFLKTNAQIYPGNSGGPLITEEGRVAGINTFKLLTRKFEGLGFAIPIDQAINEFGRFLR